MCGKRRWCGWQSEVERCKRRTECRPFRVCCGIGIGPGRRIKRLGPAMRHLELWWRPRARVLSQYLYDIPLLFELLRICQHN